MRTWIVTRRKRRSRIYLELHRTLEREVRKPEDKQYRKRLASEIFRTRGE